MAIVAFAGHTQDELDLIDGNDRNAVRQLFYFYFGLFDGMPLPKFCNGLKYLLLVFWAPATSAWANGLACA